MCRQGEDHLAAGVLDPQIEGPTVGEGFSGHRNDLVTVRASDFDSPIGRPRVHQDNLRLDRLVAEAVESPLDCLFLVLGTHHDAWRCCGQTSPLLRQGSLVFLPVNGLQATLIEGPEVAGSTQSYW